MTHQSVTAPFAVLIRERRNALCMTQEHLAREVGCPQQTIEKIETGKTKKSGYLPVIFSKLGLDLALLTGEEASQSTPRATQKFLKSSSVRFYIRDWREFMGVKIGPAAQAAGLEPDEYEAHEAYPINFTLGQIVGLADEFGIRGDQFWFPPPKGKPAVVPPVAAKKRARK